MNDHRWDSQIVGAGTISVFHPRKEAPRCYPYCSTEVGSDAGGSWEKLCSQPQILPVLSTY